jgi:hypothetical protein
MTHKMTVWGLQIFFVVIFAYTIIHMVITGSMGVQLKDDPIMSASLLCLTLCSPSIFPSVEISRPMLQMPGMRAICIRECQSPVEVMDRMLMSSSLLLFPRTSTIGSGCSSISAILLGTR